PSVKPKSPRTSSSLASGETSASSAGSRRTTDVWEDWAVAVAAAPASKVTDNKRLFIEPPGNRCNGLGSASSRDHLARRAGRGRNSKCTAEFRKGRCGE